MLATLAMIITLQASDAPTQMPPTPPAAADKKKQPDPNEVVCRREPVLGSRVEFTKTCHTRAEWDEISRATRSQLDQYQNRGTDNAPSPGLRR